MDEQYEKLTLGNIAGMMDGKPIPFESNDLNDLAVQVTLDNSAKGFHDDDQFMFQIGEFILDDDKRLKYYNNLTQLFKSRRIALMHSELSEALEGIRKNEMDDKLTNRSSEEVELADTIIRILDHSGKYNLDIAGAIQEKLAYNRSREYKHGKNF